jgi:putative oxidoreductase
MSVILVIGRILLGGAFVWLGILNFVHIDSKVEKAQSKNVPMANWAAPVGTLMIVLGGLSIMTNFQTAVGGILLIAFLVPASVMFHGFWRVKDPGPREADMIHFFKNMALTGAVLMYLGLEKPQFFG